MDVANVKNDSVVTLIPIRDILKDKKPGAYVLVARDAAKAAEAADAGDDQGELAAQWVIDSDIALTTFQGVERPGRLRPLLCQRQAVQWREAHARRARQQCGFDGDDGRATAAPISMPASSTVRAATSPSS